MDPREKSIKRVEKHIHEDAIDERRGYADRADDSLHTRIHEYGLDGHFQELLDTYAEGAVLDIACGSARWAERHLARSTGLTWLGIDLSERRIREATSRTDDPNASFVVGDAEYLPFPSDAFDTVVSSAALHHLPNWDGLVLRELARVMRDDGVLVFREPLKYNPLAYAFRRVSPGPCHTPHEHPFPYRVFKSTLEGTFAEVSIRTHHVVSLLVPFVSGVAGISFPWELAKWTYDVEQRVLRGPLKGLGMHMTGVAKRPLRAANAR